jgi:hypothetical protein
MKTNQPQLPDGDDPLDALLREADEYVPDNGFAARVLKNLPARRKRRESRFAVLSAALLIGVGVAAWQSPAFIAIFGSAMRPSSLLHWQTVLGFVPLLAALGSLVWVVFKLALEED